MGLSEPLFDMDEERFKETLRRSVEGQRANTPERVTTPIIAELDATAAAAKEGGDLREAVCCLEEAFVVKMQMLGPGNDVVLEACGDLAQSYNTLAMRMVEEEQYDEAYELLKKSEILTEEDGCLRHCVHQRLKLHGVTLNNLGCFFKRKGKLQAALHYLNKALSIEVQTNAAENPAGTLLNLCATLSQLGRHTQALAHAEKGIELLNRDRVTKNMAEGTKTAESAANMSFLAIAYHNQAVEQEFLGCKEEARASYHQACTLADQCWGSKSPMAAALRNNLKAFSKTSHSRPRSTSQQRVEYRRTASAATRRASVAASPSPAPAPAPAPRCASATCPPRSRSGTLDPPTWPLHSKPRSFPKQRPRSAAQRASEPEARGGAATPAFSRKTADAHANSRFPKTSMPAAAHVYTRAAPSPASLPPRAGGAVPSPKSGAASKNAGWTQRAASGSSARPTSVPARALSSASSTTTTHSARSHGSFDRRAPSRPASAPGESPPRGRKVAASPGSSPHHSHSPAPKAEALLAPTHDALSQPLTPVRRTSDGASVPWEIGEDSEPRITLGFRDDSAAGTADLSGGGSKRGASPIAARTGSQAPSGSTAGATPELVEYRDNPIAVLAPQQRPKSALSKVGASIRGGGCGMDEEDSQGAYRGGVPSSEHEFSVGLGGSLGYSTSMETACPSRLGSALEKVPEESGMDEDLYDEDWENDEEVDEQKLYGEDSEWDDQDCDIPETSFSPSTSLSLDSSSFIASKPVEPEKTLRFEYQPAIVSRRVISRPPDAPSSASRLRIQRPGR